MARSFRKQFVDSRVLGCIRHQIVQDYHVSYSGIELVIAVQVGRDASDEFHPRDHRPAYLIVEGLPSFVHPDDSLWRWRHLAPTVFLQHFNEIRLSAIGRSRNVCHERMTKEKGFPNDWFPLFTSSASTPQLLPPPPPMLPLPPSPLLLPPSWILLWWWSILSLLENSRW